MKLAVDLKICTGCAKCVSYCPFEAISIEDEKAVIDYQKCGVCGACIEGCRRNALSIKEG
ncbi:MAG: 4Fe-4S binding protein [Candidatus Goldbacteria bacterium]|nr:4Fe-4S binding protein [Candidatus Goldiibacteriota bacterium]